MLNNSIIIFDICGTLFKSNTTFDFLDWYLKENTFYRLYQTIYKSFLWKVFNRLLRISLGLDLTRIIAIKYLKGKTRDDLEKSADKFVIDVLSKKENTAITTILRRYLKEDRTGIYLVSATIDVVGDSVAKYFGCPNIFTTKIKYDKDGLCLGEIDEDLLGNKQSIVKYLAKDKSVFAIFTDDLTDESILKVAEQKNIIIYQKKEKQWRKLIKSNNWCPILWLMD